MNVFDYIVKTARQEDVSLRDYRGNYLLIVNTASKCGFTPQYEELEALYQKFKDRNFLILGFPCNQFKNQEPESDEQIQAFCKATYGVTFPVFAKIDVNGPHANPLYQYLKAQIPFGGFDLQHPIGKKLDEILSADDKNYQSGNDIKWNFTKFLVSPDGTVRKRYEPTTPMSAIEKDLSQLL